ncbi:MAG: phosphoribosylglycinamide formyltransferase [Planctomycetota bacterium]|jgi:phosphoribosylglycinamide formyltransferase-1
MSSSGISSLKIGVLLSGGGRTLQNLLDRIADGDLQAEIACVVSDRPEVKGLERARKAGIPRFIEKNSEAIFGVLRDHGCELICLCGYLRLLHIPEDFLGSVLNIHPALLPKFGGKGFYGDRVHSAVLEAGESESGCTVHYCDNEYDTGEILLQKKVSVLAGDDIKTLADRVFAAECEAYPQAIELWRQRRR